MRTITGAWCTVAVSVWSLSAPRPCKAGIVLRQCLVPRGSPRSCLIKVQSKRCLQTAVFHSHTCCSPGSSACRGRCKTSLLRWRIGKEHFCGRAGSVRGGMVHAACALQVFVEGEVEAAALASLAPLVAGVPGDCSAQVADILACNVAEPADRNTRAPLSAVDSPLVPRALYLLHTHGVAVFCGWWEGADRA